MLPEAPAMPEEVKNNIPDLSATAIEQYKRTFRHKWNSGMKLNYELAHSHFPWFIKDLFKYI